MATTLSDGAWTFGAPPPTTDEEAVALERYFESLQPIPSPKRVRGQLSASALRGQALFASKATGCTNCHTPPLFTNLKSYDVGTAGAADLPEEKFDTPSLVEVWRTAPYLHDGSAVTILEVLTTANREDKHGATRSLSPAELADLAEYVLSL